MDTHPTDSGYWRELMARPMDDAQFATMFGVSAARFLPTEYHLILIGEADGIAIRFGSGDLLAKARLISRHEDAFGWMAMNSEGGWRAHCALLDGVVRECAVQGHASSALARQTERIHLSLVGPDTNFSAFALVQAGSVGYATLDAVESALPLLMPSARIQRIPSALCHALRLAIPDAETTELRSLFIAATEAADIGSCARKAPAGPAHRL